MKGSVQSSFLSQIQPEAREMASRTSQILMLLVGRIKIEEGCETWQSCKLKTNLEVCVPNVFRPEGGLKVSPCNGRQIITGNFHSSLPQKFSPNPSLLTPNPLPPPPRLTPPPPHPPTLSCAVELVMLKMTERKIRPNAIDERPQKISGNTLSAVLELVHQTQGRVGNWGERKTTEREGAGRKEREGKQLFSPRPLPLRRRFPLAPVSRPPHDLPLGLRGGN